MTRKTQTIGNILVSWAWDDHAQRGSMIAIESVGVMDLDEARQVGALLLSLTTGDDDTPTTRRKLTGGKW